MTERIVLLEAVLSDLTGPNDITALVLAVNGADVDAGILTDEEVHWIGGDPDADPDEFLDAPRLARLTPDEQQIALETTLWMLQARGEAIYDPTTDLLRLEGVHAVLGDLRGSPEAAISVRVDVRGEGTRRAAIYRIRPDLFMTEEVEDAGLHHFVLRSPARQAAWLAVAVDPHGHAGDDSDPQPQTATDLNGLDPHPDRLAERCETASLVCSGSRTPDERTAQRTFTAYSGPDGVHILTGWRTDTDAQAALQRLSRRDLIEFCAAFLSGPLAARARSQSLISYHRKP